MNSEVRSYEIIALGQMNTTHVTSGRGTQEQIKALVREYWALGIPYPRDPQTVEYQPPRAVSVKILPE